MRWGERKWYKFFLIYTQDSNDSQREHMALSSKIRHSETEELMLLTEDSANPMDGTWATA